MKFLAAVALLSGAATVAAHAATTGVTIDGIKYAVPYPWARVE